MNRILYTVGHSVHSGERLISLLRANGVSAVCDVRSQPYSRRSPQFNREALKAELLAHGVSYVFLGELLGGRSADPTCFEGNRVDYRKVAKTGGFRDGLVRLQKGIEQFTVGILCAEGDPLACHRTLLVCRHLRRPGLEIRHILADGRVEPHVDTERRLLSLVGLPAGDLLSRSDEMVERAYDLRGLEIAYARSGVSDGAVHPR